MYMDTKNKIVGEITIPIYTNEESRIRTKLRLGIPLHNMDYYALATDILNNVTNGKLPDWEDNNLKLYLDKKYPNWKVDDTLIDYLEHIALNPRIS